MIKIEEVYVYLLDEDIDVWRPVDAEKVGNNLYKIISVRNSKEQDEKLEFDVGDIVSIEKRKLASGNVRKIAISKSN